MRPPLSLPLRVNPAVYIWRARKPPCDIALARGALWRGAGKRKNPVDSHSSDHWVLRGRRYPSHPKTGGWCQPAHWFWGTHPIVLYSDGVTLTIFEAGNPLTTNRWVGAQTEAELLGGKSRRTDPMVWKGREYIRTMGRRRPTNCSRSGGCLERHSPCF